MTIEELNKLKDGNSIHLINDWAPKCENYKNFHYNSGDKFFIITTREKPIYYIADKDNNALPVTDNDLIDNFSIRTMTIDDLPDEDTIVPRAAKDANLDKFEQITDKLHETYLRKNSDYGNSFVKSLDEFGLVAAVVRMNDKMERLKSLINKKAEVKDESIADTLEDLANYAIMTRIYIENHDKSNKERS